ncbi:MAG TPA: hypothetical protein VKW04_24510 [Planctomycetota bacterium]|nr:hypothetical protein [Planctomycetota bacterium]
MNDWHPRALGPILLLLAGCAATDFTEDDLGRTVEIGQGSGFFIRLARLPSGPRQAPEVRGALIRPLEKRVDVASNLEVFQFVAEGAGDAIIRIAPPDATTPEFIIQVHVLPSGKSTTAPFSSGKPPGSY